MFINNKFEKKKNIRNISIITKTVKWRNFKDVHSLLDISERNVK